MKFFFALAAIAVVAADPFGQAHKACGSNGIECGTGYKCVSSSVGSFCERDFRGIGEQCGGNLRVGYSCYPGLECQRANRFGMGTCALAADTVVATPEPGYAAEHGKCNDSLKCQTGQYCRVAAAGKEGYCEMDYQTVGGKCGGSERNAKQCFPDLECYYDPKRGIRAESFCRVKN